nr:hypothetical protein [Tanacetum cinerariifolium]
MSSLFADTHNVVAILEKSDAAEGFEQIIDFLSRSYIHYTLTGLQLTHASCAESCNGSQFTMDAIQELASPEANGFCDSPLLGVNRPRRDDDRLKLMELMVFLLQKDLCDDIRITAARLSNYCCHANVSAVWLQTLVDKKKIVISEAVIREFLQLNDAEGVVCLLNEEIFTGLAQMGYEKPSTKLTFYKAFFSSQWKFLIHTILQSLSAKRTSWNEFSTAFIQLIIQAQVGNLSTHTTRFISPALTQKVFANMRRAKKGFSREPSSPPQQPHVTPPVPTQGEVFPATFQRVLDTCSALLHRVEHLEHDNVAQRLEIVKLKARVKKLEQTDKVKSSKFRHLRKVRASRQVESSDNMEDVFNQGRMINEDEGIELVKDAEIAKSEGRQADKQAKIYNIDLDHSSKVLSMQEDDSEVQDVVEVVATAKLITEVVTVAASQGSAASATIPAVSATIPAVAPTIVDAYTKRRKGVIIRDPEEELPLKTLAETPKVKDKGKGILVEAPKPMKKKDQIEMNAEYARKLQEEIDRDHDGFNKDVDWDATMDHKAAKRRKLSEEAQEAEDLRKRLEVVEDEDDDVFVKATPLASKVPIMDYQIVLIDNKPRYKIIRADDTHQLYISFTTLLKNFDREDLETLWRITMFEEPDRQYAIWRNQKSVHGLALVKRWKLLTSCGVHVITLSTVQLFLLVERRSKKNTKCVNAVSEELTAAKHKLMLLVYCC